MESINKYQNDGGYESSREHGHPPATERPQGEKAPCLEG